MLLGAFNQEIVKHTFAALLLTRVSVSLVTGAEQLGATSRLPADGQLSWASWAGCCCRTAAFTTHSAVKQWLDSAQWGLRWTYCNQELFIIDHLKNIVGAIVVGLFGASCKSLEV